MDLNERYSDLYEPCGSGLISRSKSDFKVENTEDQLAVKAPKSQVPQLIVTAVVTLATMLFVAHQFMPDLKHYFYRVGIPIYILVVYIIYKLFDSYYKKGHWLVWNKKTGHVFFPRLLKSDTIDNFVCFQMICVDHGDSPHTELNCVFKADSYFRRYPLFLYNHEIDSCVFNMAQEFGVHVQKVRYDGKKPVISGYDFTEELNNHH